MHRKMKLAVPLVIIFLTGCSQLLKQIDGSGPAAPEVQARYEQGLVNYRESRFDAALNDLGAAVASKDLNSSDETNARKHMAFIHCASGRELPCREQFQAILKAAPGFDLAPNEANHPIWGPVWRSVKGAAEEQRAVKQASSNSASPAQQKLAEGIKDYEAGRYKEAIDTLQDSLKGGLPGKADEIRARKYSAFAYCLTQRTALCRGEFRKIFSSDPAFELLPSETGHPAWASIYRKEKKAASRRVARKK